MTEQTPRKGGRIFRVLTAIIFLLVLATLAFGLTHRSSQPVVFHRYSPEYASVLGGMFLAAFYLGWVLFMGGPRLVRWTGNIYALLISTLVVLFVVEWGLRAFNPYGIRLFHNLPYHMQGMVDDPVLGYKHPVSLSYRLGDSLVALNSHGLRDDEVPYEKPPGEKRILVLGDSVTFGWGVSQGETFPDQMEYMLNESHRGHWQAINAGVNGYNTEQEAAYLRIEGMRYSPDFVVLVYVSNDVDPVLDPNETTWRRYPSWPASLPDAAGRLRQLSFLFQLTALFTRMETMDAARYAGHDEAGEERDLHRPRLTDQPNWRTSRAALLDILQQCNRADIPLLVAIYSGHGPEFWKSVQDAGMDILDLSPAWANVPEGQSYVSRIDPHPSALVHKKIAAYLVDAMDRRGWLN